MLMRRTHIFDTDPLLQTLKGAAPKWQGRPWIYPEVLNGPASPYDVWITAVAAERRELVYFHNRGDAEIEPEMVRASCSIPLWYEPTVIKGTTYVDGGTIANTPFRKALEEGAREIVVVMMAPWPGRPVRSWKPSRKLRQSEDELLKIPQALWASFEPALDMMLTEIAWRDYLLLREEQRHSTYPYLRWIRFVVPEMPLPLGNMTSYQRDNHVRLFRMGERDAEAALADVMGNGPAGAVPNAVSADPATGGS
jgi:predicted acylesterase/phospholipase RssA